MFIKQTLLFVQFLSLQHHIKFQTQLFNFCLNKFLFKKTLMSNFQSAVKIISNRVKNFKENEKHYFESSYPEADVRNDFINKFFIAFGWNVRHEIPDQKDYNEARQRFLESYRISFD